MIGVDIGTTSIAKVVVDEGGRIVSETTIPNPGVVRGCCEQDPDRILEAVRTLSDGESEIGWTGQMHGVVAVDAELRPLTRLVTWQDARCRPPLLSAGVAKHFVSRGLKGVFKWLPITSYVIARLTGRLVVDETFRAAMGPWTDAGLSSDTLPELVPGSMLGDNQAGVYAAQKILPGCAVVNLGTSGQLSVVGDGRGGEIRPYPGGMIRCRPSPVGGAEFARLRERLGISYEELNARADEPEVASVVGRIVDDLVGDVDLKGVTGLVGVGTALRLNPALRRAVERRFGLACVVPAVKEMAAYGAALHAMDRKRGVSS